MELLTREGDVAVFSQSGDGKVYGYEVVIVQKNEAGERFGVKFEASESVPPTSAWGKEAYTCRSIENVPTFVDILKQRIHNRFKRAR